jgi:Flp pilus assembly protein CpaB
MTNIANKAAIAAFVLGTAGFYMYTERLALEVGGGKPQSVLLLTRDVAVGQVLSDEDVDEVEVPQHYLDSRRVSASELKKALGLSVAATLHAGDGLMWSDLKDGQAHQSLAELVVEGHRAFSLSAKSNPLGNLLQAGDWVDVLLEHAGASEILLERVAVLSVGDQMSLGLDELMKTVKRRPTGVTLSVTQEQAAQLFAASSKGDLMLVLRNSAEEVKKSLDPQLRTAPAPKAAELKEIEHVR